MTNAHGFQPLRYDCETSGCFNKKHRLNFAPFYRALSGRLSFSDIDAITEVNGYALCIEWKSKPGPVPTGQKIMFERLTTGKNFTVILVAGDAGSMTATHMAKVFDGRQSPWAVASTTDLTDCISRWEEWAKKNPRHQQAA